MLRMSFDNLGVIGFERTGRWLHGVPRIKNAFKKKHGGIGHKLKRCDCCEYDFKCAFSVFAPESYSRED